MTKLLNDNIISSKEFNKITKEIYNNNLSQYSSLQEVYDMYNNLQIRNSTFLNNMLSQLNNVKSLIRNNLNDNYFNAFNNCDKVTELFYTNQNIEHSKKEYNRLLPNQQINIMDFDNENSMIVHSVVNDKRIPYNVALIRNNYNFYEMSGKIDNIKTEQNHNYWHEKIVYNENFNASSNINIDLKLTPKSISKINCIKINAFCKYPIFIDSIKYKDIKTNEYKQLQIDVNYIDDSKIYSFEEIQTNELMLNIKQFHYEKINNKFIYEIGLNYLTLSYIEYATRTCFLSSPIDTNQKNVDYYKLQTKDSQNVNYSVIEYYKQPDNSYKTLIKGILQDNVKEIKNEEIDMIESKSKVIGKTKYPIESLLLFKNNKPLNLFIDYYFKDDMILLFNYDKNAKYTANYKIQSNVLTQQKNTLVQPTFVRLLAEHEITNTPCFIKEYTLLIKYKKGDLYV